MNSIFVKKFQKTKENFICEHCGNHVVGNGYTNHCQTCLWSKHVDISPGDRGEICGGVMEPVGISLDHGAYVITHRCQSCRAVRYIKSAENDNLDALISLT